VGDDDDGVCNEDGENYVDDNNNKSVTSAETKSWRPQILRCSRDRQRRDKMVANTEL
jgi:hypothetical protein